MKKSFTKHLTLFVFMLSIAISAKTQLLVADFPFSGNLSANGWNAVTTGAGVNPVATTTGLSYTGFSGSGVGNAALLSNLGGEDVNISFASQATDGQSIYYSTMANVTDAAATKAGDYFLHIGAGGGATFSSFAARVFVRVTATGVNFGLSNTSTATWGATNFSKNTTYLIIVKYTISVAGNDPASLWVIPTGLPLTEAAAGTPEVINSGTDGQNTINAVGLRQGSASTSVQTVVDGLRIGLTWAEVTPSAVAGPVISAGGNITNLVSTAGTASAEASYTLSATSLSPLADNITVTASAGLEISLVSGGPYVTTAILVPYTGGVLANTTVYVRIAASAAQGTFSGSIANSGGGATTATVTVNGGVAQNYYNTKANLGLTNVGTWSSALNGAGASPANFTAPYQYFNIVNQANANYTGVWNVTGTASKVIVGDGTGSLTFEISPGADSVTSATKIDVLNNGLLTIYNNRIPSLNLLATGSTVNFNQFGTTTADTIKIPAISYYNLYLTNGLKYFTGNTTTVRGELLADAVVGMNGPNSSPFATINAFGNVNFANLSSFDPLPGGDIGRVTLKMNGPGPTQQLNGDGTEIRVFRLQRDSTSANTILLGANTALTLGNGSSGGLQLSPAATTLSLGANTMNFIGAAVSTSSALGKISTLLGSINVLKSVGTTDAGTLRFNPGSSLTQFTLNLGPAVTRDSITIADNISAGLVNLLKGKIVMTAGDTLSALVMSAPTVAPYAFVDGAVRLTGTANLGFAVGKGNNFAPVGISDFGGTTKTYTVHYFNTGYGNYAIDPATLAAFPNYDVSRSLYWNVTSNDAGLYNAVFGYTDAAAGIINPLALRMAHFDNTDWADRGGAPDPTNTVTGGVVLVPAINVFGPFTFSALAAGIVPVNLAVFAAQKAGSFTKLSWTTEQEINSKEFAVERSIDGGRTWTSIGVVPAAGNSSVKRLYNFMDNAPVKGVNLYRLRAVDMDNRFKNSDTKAVLFGQADAVLITPNPASSFVNVYMGKNNNSLSQILVLDANGKLVEKISTSDQSYQINVSRYSKGLYVIKIIGTDNTSTQKVIIQ